MDRSLFFIFQSVVLEFHLLRLNVFILRLYLASSLDSKQALMNLSSTKSSIFENVFLWLCH